ncbi:MAG: hypothetical protein EA398_09210 [Deltaproteobacteria bacterium]|nr:MAG: hypothetical protein EA398_09210 [Deltaproteobacteria bacterium]
MLLARPGDTIACSGAGSTGADGASATTWTWTHVTPSEGAPFTPSATARDASYAVGEPGPEIVRLESGNAAGDACEPEWVQTAVVDRSSEGLFIVIGWRAEATGSPMGSRDVDVYLRRGETGLWRGSGTSVFWQQRAPTWTRGERLMNPVLVQDSIRDGGPEVLHVPSWFSEETFSVGVHYYTTTNNASAAPVLVDLLLVRDGRVVHRSEGVRLGGDQQFWHAVDFSGSSPTVTPVNAFSRFTE